MGPPDRLRCRVGWNDRRSLLLRLEHRGGSYEEHLMRTITDPSWHPPHPLGLSDHPAWAAVRQRRAELEALRAQNVPAPWWARRKS
jgi:hypothetical protein